MTTTNGAKELKRVKREKPNRCDGHVWLVDHTIYRCDKCLNENAFTVHRQCSKCGKHEVCRVTAPGWSNSTRMYDLPNLRK